ncbi:MAG: cobalamin B12-binding domain-containing protein [Tissierellia bacterium]|nr:cobalamin B12-binding domain-containing protein [Tissierellia bacterium]
MFATEKDIFAFIKPALDAHTMGLNTAAELLRDCGYTVIIADDSISNAISEYRSEASRKKVVDWIIANKVTNVGISYRLDKDDALNMVGYLLEALKTSNLLSYQGGPIRNIFFAGLPVSCEAIGKEFDGLVKTYVGGESAQDTLLKLGVPEEKIPRDIIEGSKYDESLLQFGKEIIDSGEYEKFKPIDRSNYKEFGTRQDTVEKRLDANLRDNFLPLMRAHVGPYSSLVSREENVREFLSWAKTLAEAGYLDIMSIGSSQLSQSNFGEDWGDRPNGGGVPVNSEEEYRMIYDASRPLLIRTYAGTKNIPQLAKMYEETINICWHALSLWWFNKLDNRGPYDLYTNLKQHMETIKYIASTNKPFEANVSHHFAFRGADDVTYIVSAYLAAKLAKKLGIKTFILQNMLNTPRLTWGIQDLAKSRALLKLVGSLTDSNFRVLLQPRAGLDYFKPDLYEARIQLAAVSALMDDIDPHNEMSPPIIHVVSYSEASHLATPEIINESIKITQHSIQEYRALRRRGYIDDMSKNGDIEERMNELLNKARTIINAIESSIENPYSPEGFYKIYAAGFLPTPYLWGEVDEFKHATEWKTKPIKGSLKVVDEEGKPMAAEKIAEIAKANLKDAEYNLSQRMIKDLR